MDFALYIKEIGRGARGARDLAAEPAQNLFGAMLEGRVPPLQLGAILMALRIKSESLDELLGFKRALDARCAAVAVPAGPRCVVLPTFNGARRQPNLVPLLAALLAREGVPVLVFGRHDFESRVSPFALFAALGITPAAGVDEAAAALAAGRPALLALAALAPGLDALLALRLAMGVRNSAHTVAKLLDPCPGRSVRVVAVTHPEYLERMEQFLAVEGATALLMRGTEGEPYANPRRRPRLLGFHAGAAQELYAAEEGGAPPSPDMPAEFDLPEVAPNARYIQAVLAGSLPLPTPIRDQLDACLKLARA